MEYKQEEWNLKDVLAVAEGKEYDLLLENIEKDVELLENKKHLLTEDISEKDFLEMFKLYEKIAVTLGRIGGYASLWYTENTHKPEPRVMMAKIEKFGADISNRLLFYILWWRFLPDDAAKRLLKVTGKHRYYFEKDRLFKKHTLGEKEEKVITLKDITGSNALVTLYNLMTNRYMFEVDGKKMTYQELSNLYRSPDHKIRAAAYDALLKVYGNDVEILGEVYQNLIRDWNTESLELRKYKSSIGVRNLANDLDDKAVDVLLKVCRKNRTVFQKFFEVKAKYLKLEKMGRCDIYAPFSSKEGKKFSYDEAIKLILDTFESFSPEFKKLAKKVVDEKHIHSVKTPNKKTGAFCSSINIDIIPYVLINYEGKINDVIIFAHELGHAIHSLFAKDQTNFTFHSDLPLAETASTFCEMILKKELLKKESKGNRIRLLGEAIDSIYATIMRQVYFVLFEKEAHEMVTKGATAEELSQAYLKLLKEQLGEKIEVPEKFKHEWVVIPHIYETPFYCYAYSFGKLLVLSLMKQYEKEGESFVPKMNKILSYGGSKRIQDILSEVGIDVIKEEFWEQGFKVIEEYIKELEKLI